MKLKLRPPTVRELRNFGVAFYNGVFEIMVTGKTVARHLAVSNCTHLVVAKEVEAISGTLCQDFYYLEKVEFESGSRCTRIGYRAFFRCTALKQLELPLSAVYFGESCLEFCESLKEVCLPCGTQKVPPSMFYGCYKLRNVVVPEGVTEVGGKAFASCVSLKELRLPSTVETVGAECFCMCTMLAQMTLPKRVQRIEYGLFKECLRLTGVKTWAKEVFQHAFVSCHELKEVDFVEEVTYVGEFAFESSGIKVLPFKGHELTYIRDGTFSRCERLREVIVPPGVQYVGMTAFYGCKSIKTVDLPSTCRVVADGSFLGCSNIESITVAGKTTVTARAFETQVAEKSLKAWLCSGEWNVAHGVPQNLSALPGVIAANYNLKAQINLFYCTERAFGVARLTRGQRKVAEMAVLVMTCRTILNVDMIREILSFVTLSDLDVVEDKVAVDPIHNFTTLFYH